MSSGTLCNSPSPSYDWSHRSSDSASPPTAPCAEDAGFGPVACTTFVDPWSGPAGAELDDTCASDESAVLKYCSTTCSKSSSAPRFPNTVVTPLGMCTTSTNA
jgi:hypothetical protein